MAEPRSYSVGLPVTVTVHDDGTVTYWVDTSEADTAIFDIDDFEGTLPPEEVMIADQTRIGEDHAVRFTEGRQSL